MAAVERFPPLAPKILPTTPVQSPEGTPSTPAAEAVLETAELLEAILLGVGEMKTVQASERVSKRFKSTIAGSIKLQRYLWLVPVEAHVPTAAELLMNKCKKSDQYVHRRRRHYVYLYERGNGTTRSWYDFDDYSHLQTIEVNPLLRQGRGLPSFTRPLLGEYFSTSAGFTMSTEVKAWKSDPEGSWRKMQAVRTTESHLQIRVSWRGRIYDSWKDILLFYPENNITLGRMLDDIADRINSGGGFFPKDHKFSHSKESGYTIEPKMV